MQDDGRMLRQCFLIILLVATVASFARAASSAPSSAASAEARVATASFSSDLKRQAIARALELKLDERLEWLRLVHYRKTTLSGWVSDIDNPLYFVSPDGQRDPRAELVATLDAGFEHVRLPPAIPQAPAMTVRCQYPARWKWLMRELAITDPAPDVCPELEAFRGRMRPSSATLVFSGYYINNPSSIFGHLLLRLNRRERLLGKGSELLDFGVNYGAIATTENPVLYALFGMIGVFKGNFTPLPYYYKVREYSDAESRDLWEYELNLAPDEVERLVDHLWELGSAYFNYYYFSKNCAFHLLALLEAAAPRLHLIDRVHFYVMPADSLKAVAHEPGLVAKVHYRASTLRQLQARYSTLSSDEKRAFLAVRGEKNPVEKTASLEPVGQARVLDAVLDDIDYRNFHDLVFKTNPFVTEKKQAVLSARAQLPVGEELKIEVHDADHPELSHPSGRWSFAAGRASDADGSTTALDGEIRFALHDITDPLDGYLPYSQVESWLIRGRWWSERRRLELRHFYLVRAASLAPLSWVDKKPAWRFDFGVDRVRDRRCIDCLAGRAAFLGGASVEPLAGVLLYALVGPTGETSADFNREKFLLSAEGRIGLRYRISHFWQIDGEGEWRRVFDRETFDRLSAVAKTRFDFGDAALKPWALEFEYANEAGNEDFLARYLRFF